MLLCVEGRVVGAGEAYRVLVVAVAWLIVAVEKHLGLIYASVKQTVHALSAGMVILAQLVDEILLIYIVQITVAAAG